MWPDRVSNPGPLTYESGALPIALSGPGTDSADPEQDMAPEGKSHVLKMSENSLVLRTREFTDIFITFDEI